MLKFRNLLTSLLLGLALILTNVHVVAAQDDEGYRVSLRRDFGYGAGSNVRGTMSISLVGDETQVQQVIFLIGGEEMATVNQAPFKFQFDTDQQGAGWHDLSANVLMKDGTSITTDAIRYNFVTQEEQNSGMKNILVPIGVVVIAAIGISTLVQMIGRPKKPTDTGKPRDYGPLGGTICPKCGHPFPRSRLGMNLVVGRLERCESCKRFVMTRRATPAELASAEAAERVGSVKPAEPILTEEQERDQLDESKYIDQL